MSSIRKILIMMISNFGHLLLLDKRNVCSVVRLYTIDGSEIGIVTSERPSFSLNLLSRIVLVQLMTLSGSFTPFLRDRESANEIANSITTEARMELVFSLTALPLYR